VLLVQVSALSHKGGQVLRASASDGATVVAVERAKAAGRGTTTPDADIYLLHKFECQKIATRYYDTFCCESKASKSKAIPVTGHGGL
jgi:hypothetical protein